MGALHSGREGEGREGGVRGGEGWIVGEEGERWGVRGDSVKGRERMRHEVKG